MRFLERLVPDAMGAVRLTLDWRVLGFSAGIGIASALVFGLAPAAACSMTALLYGFQPNYVPAVIGVSVILEAVASCACLVPSRRASRVDPVVALRNE